MSLPLPPRQESLSDVTISGSLGPPAAAQACVFAGDLCMASVGAGCGAEAGGGVRVGAFAPPGCYRAWPPPLRPTDVAGPLCAGSVCAAGRRPASPVSHRVSVPPRPLTPGKPPWRTRPGSALGPAIRAVSPLAFPQPQNLPFRSAHLRFGRPSPRGFLTGLSDPVLACDSSTAPEKSCWPLAGRVTSNEAITLYQIKRYVRIAVSGGDPPLLCPAVGIETPQTGSFELTDLPSLSSFGRVDFLALSPSHSQLVFFNFLKEEEGGGLGSGLLFGFYESYVLRVWPSPSH